MISIVIPLYNKKDTIANTIDCVLHQTYTDFEIVVVDDGSTDGSADAVAAIADPHIRLIRQENGGVSAARNRGIAEARGEYVAFLDADDEWMPDYLANQHALTEKYPNCDVFTTDYLFRNAKGVESGTILRGFDIPVGSDAVFKNYFKVASCSHPPLWTSAVMVRKKAIEAVDGFPVGIRSGEDLLTWARLAAKYNIAYLRKPLAVFVQEGYENNERPKREPAEYDMVAEQLVKLYANERPPYIKRYISLWHKMRSAIYMRLGMRRKSIQEALKGIQWYPLNWKLYAYVFLNLVPNSFK